MFNLNHLAKSALTMLCALAFSATMIGAAVGPAQSLDASPVASLVA
jgi:hypothetical protein